MIFLNIGVLTGFALGVWWLTGIDKTYGGESKRDQYLARAIRCALVLFFATIFLWLVESKAGYASIPLLMIVLFPIALLLRSSISELFTHGFLRMVDPMLHDDRPMDTGKSRRYLDTIAHLIQNGRRDEAIKLCEEFKRTGEVDIMALEMTLEYLGVKQESARNQTPIQKAAHFRAQKNFAEAERFLKSLLAKNPRDLDAAMMLARLYAQDLHEPDKAHEVLRALEQQPHVPADHIEFARRSIPEWNRPRPPSEKIPAPPESVDELLALKYFGTAIEVLEQKLREQPRDFDLWLKLAETQGRHCGNIKQAEKIVEQMKNSFAFDAGQIQAATSKLGEWRAAQK